jgi:hypothetical protein
MVLRECLYIASEYPFRADAQIMLAYHVLALEEYING